MSAQIKTWLDFLIQQMVAESYLDQAAELPGGLADVLRLGNNNWPYLQRDTRPDTPNLPGQTRLTDSQIKYFNENFDIIDHRSDDDPRFTGITGGNGTGFSATLMRNRSSGEYTLSFRSLEYADKKEGGDWERDGVFGTAGEIKSHGFALAQIAAMEQYYEYLKTTPGRLPPGAVLNVTGYSLGGHLATVFTELHPLEVNHAYTFNAPGHGIFNANVGNLNDMISYFRSVLRDPNAALGEVPNENDPNADPKIVSDYEQAKNAMGAPWPTNLYQASSFLSLPLPDPRYWWAMTATQRHYSATGIQGSPGVTNATLDGKITSLYGQAAHNDSEWVANAGVHATSSMLFIEDQPDIERLGVPWLDKVFGLKSDFGTTHSIALLADSLAVMGLFERLGLSIDTPSDLPNVYGLLSGASNERGTGFFGQQGEAEGDSLEKVVEALHKLFLNNDLKLKFDRRNAGFGNLTNRNAFYQALEAINEKLGSNPSGYRLLSLADKTVDELIDMATGPNGIAVRYALKEGNPFAVIKDDALYAPHNNNGALDLYNPGTRQGAITDKYIELRSAFLERKLYYNSEDARYDTSIGTEEGDSTATKYDPDDIIWEDKEDGIKIKRGAGTSGMTRYVLFGSDASDDLAGKDRDDSLFGGGGLDILTGGQGDDYLEGGQGEDIYYYSAGDGHDTLLDTDDLGGIVYHRANGEVVLLTGGRLIAQGSNVYQAPTQPYAQYRRETNGDLTILLDGVEAITVRNHRSGALGIDLHDTGGILLPVDPREPGDTFQTGRVIITGTTGNDDAELDTGEHLPAADPLTREIYGLAGDDTMNGRSGVRGYVATILLDGGPGIDRLFAERNQAVSSDHFIMPYYQHYARLGRAGFEAEFGRPAEGEGATLLGGEGMDMLQGGLLDDILNGGQDPDLVAGSVGDDRLYGGDVSGDGDADADSNDAADNDWLDGSNGRDTIEGQSGDDRLLGGEGDDVIRGGDGDDFLYGDTSTNFLDGWDGQLTTLGDDPARAGTFSVLRDVAETRAGDDTLEGGAGVDRIVGGAGNDLVDGGTGDDILAGEGGADIIFGSDGNDRITGSSYSDWVAYDNADYSVGQYTTYTWRERHVGVDGDDYIDGGAGDDLIWGDAGDDYLLGGDGSDWLMGDAGAGDTTTVGNDFLDGGEGNDFLFGEEGNDELEGGDGDDELHGDEGDDYLNGGDGNDLLFGGAGADVLDGGAGADTIILEDSGDIAYLDGADQVFTGSASNFTLQFENGDINQAQITHSQDADGTPWLQIAFDADNVFQLQNGVLDRNQAFVFGSGTLNQRELMQFAPALDFTATAGNDVVRGSNHDDRLDGGAGNDTLDGQGGNDLLLGSDGDDILISGTGNDLLRGGAGNDTYVFDSGDGLDTVSEESGIDAIRFGTGTRPVDVAASITAGDLKLAYGNGDVVTVAGWAAGSSAVESVVFEDGTIWDKSEILRQSGFYFFESTGFSANDTAIQTNYAIVSDPLQTFAVHPITASGAAYIPFFANVEPTSEGLDVDIFYSDAYGNSYPPGIPVDSGSERTITKATLRNGADGTLGAFRFSSPSQDLVTTAGAITHTGTYIQTGATSPLYAVFKTQTSYYDIRKVVYTGTNGDDTLFPLQSGPLGYESYYYDGAGNDVMYGSGGRDNFVTGGGNDTMFGGLGYDSYYINPSNANLIFDDGRGETAVSLDSLYITTSAQLADLTFTRDGNDLLINNTRIQRYFERDLTNAGEEYPYKIEFLFGNGWQISNLPEYLTALGLYGKTVGTAGSDSINGDNFNNDISGLAGDDILRGNGGDDLLYGGEGHDSLDGGAGQDLLRGGVGDDSLQGNTGHDRLFGEEGDDFAQGASGNDYLDGGAGIDEMLGGQGRDNVFGGEGDDVLWGDDPSDTGSYGNANYFFTRPFLPGNDVLDGGAGEDILFGGSGGDIYRINRSGGLDLIQERNSNVFQTKIAELDAELASFDTYSGTTYSNFSWLEYFLGEWTGGPAPADYPQSFVDAVVAIGGEETISVAQARAALAEIRSFMVHSQDDVVEFGPGITRDNITVQWNNSGTYVDELGDTLSTPALLWMDFGNNEGLMIQADDDNFGIERFHFADGLDLTLDQVLALDADRSPVGAVPGTAGNDLLSGTAWHDSLYGYAGDDVLRGQANSDALYGGTGSDILVGGSGIDLTSGDAGSDVYLYNAGDGDADGESITDWAYSTRGAADVDTLSLGGGINPEDLEASLAVSEDLEGLGDRVLLLRLRTTGEVINVQWAATYDDGTSIATQSMQLERVQFRGTANDRVFDLAGLVAAREAELRAAFDADPETPSYVALFRSSDLVAFDITSQVGFAGGSVALNYALGADAAQLPGIYGNATPDLLSGDSIAQALYGFAGDDSLLGLAGNDRLNGGPGADSLQGGAGSDTYVYNVGDGADTIDDPAAVGETNTLVFGSGIDPNAITLGQGSLLIRTGTPGDEIHIVNFNPRDVFGLRAIDRFQFSDGTVLSYNQLLSRGFDIAGTAGNDTLGGTNILDRINGGAGNDIIAAGAGNDTIRGEGGNDTYVFNRGDGVDTIYDLSSTGEGNRIRFGAGISVADLSFSQVGNVLTINVGTAGDAIVLPDFNANNVGGTAVVAELEFADGGVISLALLADRAPVVAHAIADQHATEDSSFTFALPNDAFADPDAGDTLTYRAGMASGLSLPAWLAFDPATRTFSGTPANAEVGALDIRVIATDSFGRSASDIFTVSVANTNDAPTLVNAIADQSTPEDAMFTFQIPGNTFTDVDAGDSLTYSATASDGSALPAWLSFNSSTGMFSGTPGNEDVGSLDIRVAATDSSGISASDVFTVTVTNVNDAPILATAIADQTAKAGNLFSYTVSATAFADVDFGDTLMYSAALQDGSPLPPWLTFDAVTRTLNGTPGVGDIGSLNVLITAIDSGGLSATDTFSLAVTNANSAPAVTAPLTDQSVDQYSAFAFAVPANAFNDPDAGDRLSYSASLANGAPLPAWLHFDPVTQTFTGRPTHADTGNVSVRVVATDLAGLAASSTFGLSVVNTTPSNVTGTANNDVLSGASGAEYVQGMAGNDTIDGGAGNDVIIGGLGIDTLRGGDGDDLFLIEGADTAYDTVSGGLGLDTVLGGAGDDTFRFANFSGSNTVEVIDGDAGSNVIAGTANNDVLDFSATTLLNISKIDAGAGNDTVTGSNGNDLILGGAGIDTLRGGDGDDIFSIESSDAAYDTVNGGLGLDTVRGGAADDIFRFANFSGANTVEVIDGSGGNNIVAGTANNDVLDFSGTSLVNVGKIDAGGGNDTVTGSSGSDLIFGGAGIDTLKGGDGDDIFVVEGSDSAYDTVSGGLGIDKVWGGMGDDTFRFANFSGANTVEVVDGMAGTNLIVGTDNNDVLDFSGTSLANISKIDAGAGNDTVTGSSGDELIIGGSGIDTLRGGDGDDTFSILATDTAYDIVNGGLGMDAIRGGAGDDTFRFANFSGDNTVEVIDGAGGTNVIAGTANNDVLDFSATTLLHIGRIDAGAGNDTIMGGATDDLIIGGAGIDTLKGGDGNDIFLIEGTDTAYDAVNGGAGTDTVLGGGGDDTLRFANFSGSNTVEVIDGAGGANVIAGTGNNDVLDFSDTALLHIANIDAGAGNDTVVGSSGNDLIFGGSGIDTVKGGDGNDLLDAGTGNDSLNGGLGNDTYIFNRTYGLDSLTDNDATAGNQDTVSLGVNRLDTVFVKSGNNLQIKLHGGADTLTVNSWYLGAANQTEVIRTQEGSTLLNTQVDQLIQAMAQFSASHGGITWDQAIDQNPSEVQAVLAAYWQPA